MLISLLPPALVWTAPPQVVRPAPAAGLTRVDRQVLAMGTELHLHLEGTGTQAPASEAALQEVARIERACSTWDAASSWSQLNAAQGAPVALSAEWVDLLEVVQDWSSRTEGAFDPVLGALLKAWDVRGGGSRLSATALSAARAASGAHLLRLDRSTGTIRLDHPQAGLEEGGFLKGYALDRMKAVAGSEVGLLDFGGQLLAWGLGTEVSIAQPQDRQRPRIRLQLREASLSCSGTSERGRHILDPRTGQLCEAWGSTAVVAPDGLTADVLSTALYVMGPQTGLAWAERTGTAAAFLLNNGTVRMSTAFRSLHPTLLPSEPR